MQTETTLETCQKRDANDPLAALRAQFSLPEGVIYLDGNSLGALPKATPSRVAQLLKEEWGTGLVRSWNDAGWVTLPIRVGDKIASLIGAKAGEVVATDSTSVNLYKVLSAAIDLAKKNHPHKTTILSERSNFPTDLYIAQSLCSQHGMTLELIEADAISTALKTGNAAVLLLTHVHYRSGALHDMAAITAQAHAAGCLTVWDLAHSAGAVPVDLHASEADFAVGCGYKYLNGGPGAPAFVWVHPRHVNHCTQPLAGWFGHQAPFAFTPEYAPASGIQRYLCGTQPMLSLAALECGVDTVLAAAALSQTNNTNNTHKTHDANGSEKIDNMDNTNGSAALKLLRHKSLALTALFMELVESRCAGYGLELVTPREERRRGSQVSISREEGAYAIMQALIARGVIGDYRAGDPLAPSDSDRKDILRFGFTPLYTRFEDVWHAVEHLRQVLQQGEWKQEKFQRRNAVT